MMFPVCVPRGWDLMILTPWEGKEGSRYRIPVFRALFEGPAQGQMVRSLAREPGHQKPHFAVGLWEPRNAGCTPGRAYLQEARPQQHPQAQARLLTLLPTPSRARAEADGAGDPRLSQNACLLSPVRKRAGPRDGLPSHSKLRHVTQAQDAAASAQDGGQRQGL